MTDSGDKLMMLTPKIALRFLAYTFWIFTGFHVVLVLITGNYTTTLWTFSAFVWSVISFLLNEKNNA
jgi:hypothetical protein